jgi:hypothetical protein
MHPGSAIEAAERCIAKLRRGAVISTTDLMVMCDAAGEPCEMLSRRVTVGWFPLGNIDLVIERLEGYIDDRRLELTR